MVQDKKAIGFQRELSACLPLVIAKLDFVGAVEEFHDGADLAAY